MNIPNEGLPPRYLGESLNLSSHSFIHLHALRPSPFSLSLTYGFSLLVFFSPSLFPSQNTSESHSSSSCIGSRFEKPQTKNLLQVQRHVWNCGYSASSCKWRQDQKRWNLTTKGSKSKGSIETSSDDPIVEGAVEKKGTIAGAVALIIGTSIGSGILALPMKASPAGIVPSSITMILCWGFLLIQAFLLVEVNVGLRRKEGKMEDGNELEIISIRTMAQDTLGDLGGNLATITYVFLGYTSMVAYASKSGEILFHLLNLPEAISGCVFTVVFTLLISIGGAATTDRVNQWLTASMIGLLLAIEVLCIVFGGWSGMIEGGGDWGKVSDTVPVMIFSLVYHDLAPVLCAYLGGDLARLRTSILIGSFVPLLALLVWDAIALGLSAQADPAVDPIDLLMNVRWSGIPFMVQAFSLLAVGTSLIGTLLGFSEFFKEQLRNLAWNKISSSQDSPEKTIGTAMTMAVAPTLVVSAAVPDAFSAATDIAGGYCMVMLYGVLPPAMAWSVHVQKGMTATTRVVLLGAGTCACGIVMDQFLQDFSGLWHN
ncbi:unnamed protein product [Linum tenue]|uniref:Tyrosine-specific transport protein n=1 Tax=Linum tenue TaxID=586396 RepID=A0AAV0JP87_9ROSI|nr:unnamed protein product [Linum tenue]